MTEPHPPTTQDSAAASSIARLRAGFDGRVTDRDDPRYDQARAVFAGGIDRFPAVIVRPTNADEIAHVAVARNTGLELAVRSGGHSGAGHSVSEGGIVLDLSQLRAIDIDVEGRTAWAETGLTAGHPIPVPAAPVGVRCRRAGAARNSGGHRCLHRRSRGRARQADHHRRRDAGAADAVRSGRVPRPARDPGHVVLRRPADEAKRALAPFRALADPIADMVRPIRYPEMFPPDPEDYHPVSVTRTSFVDSIDRAAAKLIVDRLAESSAAMAVPSCGSSAARSPGCPTTPPPTPTAAGGFW